MGNACCHSAPPLNPDGSPKEPQTDAQKKEDPLMLRKAAKDGEVEEMETMLRRMLRPTISLGCGPKEGGAEEVGERCAEPRHACEGAGASAVIILRQYDPRGRGPQRAGGERPRVVKGRGCSAGCSAGTPPVGEGRAGWGPGAQVAMLAWCSSAQAKRY